MEQSYSSEANSRLARQEIPSFYGIERFIAVFTRFHYWTLTWATWIHFTPSKRWCLSGLQRCGPCMF